MKVTIWGNGWVGKAMHILFPDAYVYDPNLDMGTIDGTKGADYAFICVPTNLKDGKLDCSIVEDCVSKCDADLIVIRSTVMPGTSDKLSLKYNKKIVMQPEYLGETPNHPMSDQKARQFLIIGGDKADRQKLIELYQTVYNANTHIREVTKTEAEVIKLTENRAIAFKVAQCQELYDVCERAFLNYNEIREAVYGDDPRFNLWWTFVMPKDRGFHSKCIPKDVYGWCAWAESYCYDPKVTKTVLEVNERWLKNEQH